MLSLVVDYESIRNIKESVSFKRKVATYLRRKIMNLESKESTCDTKDANKREMKR